MKFLKSIGKWLLVRPTAITGGRGIHLGIRISLTIFSFILMCVALGLGLYLNASLLFGFGTAAGLLVTLSITASSRLANLAAFISVVALASTLWAEGLGSSIFYASSIVFSVAAKLVDQRATNLLVLSAEQAASTAATPQTPASAPPSTGPSTPPDPKEPESADS